MHITYIKTDDDNSTKEVAGIIYSKKCKRTGKGKINVITRAVQYKYKMGVLSCTLKHDTIAI